MQRLDGPRNILFLAETTTACKNQSQRWKGVVLSLLSKVALASKAAANEPLDICLQSWLK